MEEFVELEDEDVDTGKAKLARAGTEGKVPGTTSNSRPGCSCSWMAFSDALSLSSLLDTRTSGDIVKDLRDGVRNSSSGVCGDAIFASANVGVRIPRGGGLPKAAYVVCERWRPFSGNSGALSPVVAAPTDRRCALPAGLAFSGRSGRDPSRDGWISKIGLAKTTPAELRDAAVSTKEFDDDMDRLSIGSSDSESQSRFLSANSSSTARRSQFSLNAV